MGTEFNVDRLTDMTELVVAFRNFEKAPKNVLFAILCEWERLGVADEDKFLIWESLENRNDLVGNTEYSFIQGRRMLYFRWWQHLPCKCR